MPTVNELFDGAKKRRKQNLAEALTPPLPDPLADVPYGQGIEKDCENELDAMQTAFRGRRAGEDRRFRNATDSEYWFVTCFQSRAEKEAFLANTGLAQLGDKYIDGAKAAQILGVTNA